MLFYIYQNFVNSYHFLNLFHYISFRSITAFIISFVFSLSVFPSFIRFAKKYIKQSIRTETYDPEHAGKIGTPTMGGVIIIIAILIATLLTANLSNTYVLVLLFVLITFGMLGFADDFLKTIC